jgi:protein-L-isoaspartate O-methyltransferase
MEFISQVKVWSYDRIFLRAVVPTLAQQLIASGRAIVEVKKRKRVEVVRLVEHQTEASLNEMRLWPGSYGIKRDLSTVPGHLIFDHKHTYAEELASA